MDFPPTFVINLPERNDRLESLRLSFADWPVPVERVNAVRAKPGWKGCIRSHKKALEICKQRGYPYAIVLEDDCVLTEQGKQNLYNILPILKQRSSEWDIFLGGVTYVDSVNVKQTTPPLFEVKCFAAHFCLYNARSIDKMLNTLNENEPFDVFLKKNMRLWCTAPHIALQAESYSDIENTHTNYHSLFETSTQKLTKQLKPSNVLIPILLFTGCISILLLIKR